MMLGIWKILLQAAAAWLTIVAADGIEVGRDRVRHRMGLGAVYPKPRTTISGDPSERFPCLVDLERIKAPDEVWATDITYIPLRKGFLYLVAIVDLYSRHVISWKLSNSLDTEFCLEALEMALNSTGRVPEIFNTDQGCQFTSAEWTGKLSGLGVKISMDGKGR